MKAKDVIKILEHNGWQFVSQNGSHKKYKNSDFDHSIVIPEHGNKDLGIGLLNKILKQAGLK